MTSSCHTSSSIRRTTNERIYDRNIPSQTLQPYLDARPRSTRFQVLPIVETGLGSERTHVALEQEPVYDPRRVFNPGNTQSPWSGFVANINKESELRNQLFALQACSQNVYVPSSDSDLYQSTMPSVNMASSSSQPFPGLFQKERWDPFNPNPEDVGQLTFFNDTRQEIRVMPSRKRNKERCD